MAKNDEEMQILRNENTTLKHRLADLERRLLDQERAAVRREAHAEGYREAVRDLAGSGGDHMAMSPWGPMFRNRPFRPGGFF